VSLKPFREYVDPAPDWWESSLEDYARAPAAAFLRETVHITDAINQCRRNFKRKNTEEFNKDSQDSIYRLGAAALSSLMSHFETFQRSLFAGAVEATRFIPGFDIERCCQRLQKDSALSIDLARISGYRGQPAPIGQLMADNLSSWHDPARVNAYFGAVIHDYTFFANDAARELRILWQLRHAVVHTGGWLTMPDAQKLSQLADLAGQPILLNENFIEAAARRLHRIVGPATSGFGAKFLERLSGPLSRDDREVVETLFAVISPRQNWLTDPTV
jgi:hypothetical protein